MSDPTLPPALFTDRSRRLGPVIRWLHLYGSMLGLAALLFFSATGITLNHPEWMLGGTRREASFEGRLDPAWIRPDLAADKVSRLEIVERLRRDHAVQGALDEFRVDDREILVAFKGPGYAADAFADRAAGTYRITVVREGWVAVMNDLHKGRHTGAAWAWIIDLTAGLLVVVSASGLAFLLILRRRRLPGLVVGFVGTAVLVAAAWWLVP